MTREIAIAAAAEYATKGPARWALEDAVDGALAKVMPVGGLPLRDPFAFNEPAHRAATDAMRAVCL